WFPTSPRLRRRPSLRGYEVDGDGNALEPEPRAQLVLDPVAVVARDQAPVVHEQPEARRTRRDLRPVEQVQASTPSSRRLPRLAQLLEGAVELGRRDPAREADEERLDELQQTLEPASGLRRDGDDRRPLAKARRDLWAHVLEADLCDVPLRE